MNKPYISIVIPAYNEETNIRLGALDKVARYLATFDKPWEVLIVNDGSNDGTAKLAGDFAKTNKGFYLLNMPHRGKAATVVSGMKEAKGLYILFSDLDQATPLKELEKLLPYVNQGYEVIIGSRSSHREGAPLLRLIMARGFMALRSAILGLHGIRDSQCGFKIFSKTAAMNIVSRLRLYSEQSTVSGSMVTAGFDIELLYIAKELGYKIREVPVEWHYVETRRVSPLKDSWQGLIDIIRIRTNAIRKKYQIAQN